VGRLVCGLLLLICMIRPYVGLKVEPCFEGLTIYDYDALTSMEEFKALAEDSTMILAFDTESRATNIVYGLEVLRAIQSEIIPTQVLTVRCFALNYASTGLQNLCAAVEATKGFHEWSGEVTG
jgi:hypothetical protein